MIKIDDDELVNKIRQNILDILELWASKDKQLAYQENVPIAQVSAELFCQWADDFYDPDSIQFNLAFDENEREILAEFDRSLDDISERLMNNLPYITDFVKTNEWLSLNQLAAETLDKIDGNKQG